MMIERNDKLQMFLDLFMESVKLKDRGLLHGSLGKRREATELAAMSGNPALRAIGKANEATLLGYHIGDGIAAFAAAKDALSNPELFAAADKEWHRVTGLTLFEDILNIIRQWSESYDEYFQYCRLYAKYYPNKMPEKDIKELENARNQVPEWWKFQIGYLAHAHFSRESAAADKGAYGPGMSVLQCVLSRALAGRPGYDIEYVYFEHTLDDYIVISHRQFSNVLMKYQAAHGRDTNPGSHNELSIILDEPLRIWGEFMPDMREADKAKYSDYLQMCWLNLAMLHAQDKVDALGKYFPDAFTACPNCGRRIVRQSPICRYCGKMNGAFEMPGGMQGNPAAILARLAAQNPHGRREPAPRPGPATRHDKSGKSPRILYWLLAAGVLLVIWAMASFSRNSVELVAGHADETVAKAYNDSVPLKITSKLTVDKTGGNVDVPKDMPGYSFWIHGVQKGAMRVIEVDRRKIPMITIGFFNGEGYMKVVSLKEHPELVAKLNLSPELAASGYVLLAQVPALSVAGVCMIVLALALLISNRLFKKGRTG